MSPKEQIIQTISCKNSAWFVFSVEVHTRSGRQLSSGDIPVGQTGKLDLREGGLEEGMALGLWINPVMGKKQAIKKRICYAPQGIDLMIELKGSSISFSIIESRG